MKELPNIHPSHERMAALAKQLSVISEQEIFSLIGPRPEGTPLIGIEVLLAERYRLILNRFQTATECPVHDHGGLSGILLFGGEVLIQRYDVVNNQPSRRFGPDAQFRVPSYTPTTLLEESEVHSFRPLRNKVESDVFDIAIYYHADGSPLGELRPWRIWEPGSCANCKNRACNTKAR